MGSISQRINRIPKHKVPLSKAAIHERINSHTLRKAVGFNDHCEDNEGNESNAQKNSANGFYFFHRHLSNNCMDYNIKIKKNVRFINKKIEKIKISVII